LLGGKYQQRYGFEENPSPQTPPNYGMPDDQTLLPAILKDAGYATGMQGKWHLGFRPPQHPMSKGFDDFFGFLAGAHGYFAVGAGQNTVLNGREAAESVSYLTTDFGKGAEKFVDANKDKPFFLYLAFNAIHTPMQAPNSYLEKYKDVKDPLRLKTLAMISAMDDAIGGVMERIRANQLEENTIIIFYSDNGGPTGGNGSRNTPLRGFKNQTFEGGIRVPAAMQWPGHIKPGTVYEQPIITLDVLPTLLNATGTAMPKDRQTDGVDLIPYLNGGKTGRPHDNLFWRYGEKWAVRSGDLKLIANGPVEPQLYDLSKDIAEAHDLSDSQPENVAKLQKLWDDWSSQMHTPLWLDPREKNGKEENATTDDGEAPATPQKRRGNRRDAGGGEND
jgi:arylsulfatase A-like enzyme